jgi:hypothetical protein
LYKGAGMKKKLNDTKWKQDFTSFGNDNVEVQWQYFTTLYNGFISQSVMSGHLLMRPIGNDSNCDDKT